jgi:fucose permease
LVSLAFYIAYTVGSLLYLLISYVTKGDLINRIGYKNSLALGLAISALGTLLFYPAANTGSFPLMLSGLFIVALGFSLQQTVANPLAIALGPITTGSQRLTMAGGINNLGTTIGPLIVSFAIFGSATSEKTEMSIESVKIPYRDPLTGKSTVYVPDFLVVYVDKTHKKHAELWEIKPANQTLKEKVGKNVYNQAQYVKNMAKWEAASAWARQHGVKFRVINEQDLFHTGKK